MDQLSIGDEDEEDNIKNSQFSNLITKKDSKK